MVSVCCSLRAVAGCPTPSALYVLPNTQGQAMLDGVKKLHMIDVGHSVVMNNAYICVGLDCFKMNPIVRLTVFAGFSSRFYVGCTSYITIAQTTPLLFIT